MAFRQIFLIYRLILVNINRSTDRSTNAACQVNALPAKLTSRVDMDHRHARGHTLVI